MVCRNFATACCSLTVLIHRIVKNAKEGRKMELSERGKYLTYYVLCAASASGIWLKQNNGNGMIKETIS